MSIMNQTLEISNAREYVKGHLVEVFATMLSMKAVFAPGKEPPRIHERVSGTIGFGGDLLKGAVYLHFSNSFAVRAAGVMLRLPPGEVPADRDINDAVGEISNMLTGGLKSWFCDAGADCAISTPGIIRGSSFEIEPMPGVQRTVLVFDCDSQPVVVEIHIKFATPSCP